jgi:hypothetical protein
MSSVAAVGPDLHAQGESYPSKSMEGSSMGRWRASDLREAAVDEQFRSGDVACVVGKA